MRNPSLFRFTALVLFGLFFTQCKEVEKNEAYFKTLSKYVTAYSHGSIASKDPILIQFTSPVVKQNEVGTPATAFSIAPAVEGEAVWRDAQTILLQPTAPLEFGKTHVVKVDLHALFPDVPKNLSTFSYDLFVRQLGIEVDIHGIESKNATTQAINGTLRASETLTSVEVKNMLSAAQNGSALTINVEESSNNRDFNFVVENVQRAQNTGSVDITWSGKGLNSDVEGKRSVDIPGLGDFKMLNAQVIGKGTQHIRINFSDPINPSQNLSGLVQIDGYSGRLRILSDGNNLLVYPNRTLDGDQKILINGAIESQTGQKLDKMESIVVSFVEAKPGIRLVGIGNIVPKNDAGKALFPFEAVGLNAVDIEIFKIYNSNILHFLQTNNLDGSSNLERVGKIIHQQKVDLASLNPNADTKNWSAYALDLNPLIEKDPAAIYQVRMVFRKSYTTQNCASSSFDDQTELTHLGKPDAYGNLTSLTGEYRGIYTFKPGYNYDNEDDDEGYFQWSNRENPCKKEYYCIDNFVSRNIFVSNIGVMAKGGTDKSLLLLATDLQSAQPLSGVELDIYNYQLQKITSVTTNNKGTAFVDKMNDKPFLVSAKNGKERGYLRLPEGSSLSMSRFDVAGVESQDGLKGYMYGERGVWRPGDSIFLNLVLENHDKNLPTNHPVIFEVHDARGALRYKNVQNQGVNGVYPLHFDTDASAPTGNWQAKCMVGGATFTKTIRVETVKPNRLKIEMDFGQNTDKPIAYAAKSEAKINVRWLHGATGNTLPVKVDMQLQASTTTFEEYKDFVFDDHVRNSQSQSALIFDGKTNENGVASVPLDFAKTSGSAGKLQAKFRVRAFEKSGDFSTNNFALEFSPYDRYVGVSIPDDRWGGKTVDREKGSKIRFAFVDKMGKPVANKAMNVGLYRLEWRWWWDGDAQRSLGRYNTTNHSNALRSQTITTNSQGIATWDVTVSDWGRYMIRAIDPVGGHSTSDFFWSGSPSTQNSIAERQAASMLRFSADKESYNTGETVELSIPASADGQIFVSLENGERVLSHFWEDAKAGDNKVRFTTNEDMTSTLYAHVMLLQPHGNRTNDLPIRLYGIVPIKVVNPKAVLEPQIAMPDVLKPGNPFTVSVSEKTGSACAYTLALVDDGLLDLTNFKTPNPAEVMQAREGLGVQTWDIFDYVLGAFGGSLDRILGIGGDAFNQKSKNAAQVNRFKPVIKHIGPFYLKPGQKAEHTLQIDNYVGSVRAMLVCSNPQGKTAAYGKSEKTCPVRQPLMVMPTLPRVLGPGETFRLPVNVFAMEKKVKNANITVKSSENVQVLSGPQNLSFLKPGDKMAYFDVKVGNKTGPAYFTIQANGSGEKASQKVEIEVRNPTPMVTSILMDKIEPQGNWTKALSEFDMTDFEDMQLEISAIKPINLSRHLSYLIRYPYGCVEQTTSAAFPQLYVDAIAPLSEKQQAKITKNVTAALDKLVNFQTSSGGFSYWPNGGREDAWATNYVGHFLIEAKNKGYKIPSNMLTRWATYEKNQAQKWSATTSNRNWVQHQNQSNQAYRLFALAAYGQADLANMNRLKAAKGLFGTNQQLLAAAYAYAGQGEVANQLINSNKKRTFEYLWWGGTYGSTLRDRAFELESYATIGNMPKAQNYLEKICVALGNENRWYSTQELASCLRAIGKYAEKASNNQPIVYNYKLGGKNEKINSKNLISRIDLGTTATNQNFNFTNKSNVPLYVRLVAEGHEAQGKENTVTKNISLYVRYRDAAGELIDPTKIKQGTDFFAEVNVKKDPKSTLNFQFREMALSQIFPSGWEILSTRMSSMKLEGNSSSEYQDYQDDRIYTFFDLPHDNFVTYRVQLNATYPGRYYLPGVSCEAMYDERIRAREKGQWVEVL